MTKIDSDKVDVSKLPDHQRLELIAKWLKEPNHPEWCQVASRDMQRIAKRIKVSDEFMYKLTRLLTEFIKAEAESPHNDLDS